MSNNVAAITETVTIAATAGTATCNTNGLIAYIYVSPVGSPSAANASVVTTIAGEDFEVIASEAVSTSAAHQLYSNSSDTGPLLCSAATPVKVVFDTATNDDQYTVVFQLLR